MQIKIDSYRNALNGCRDFMLQVKDRNTLSLYCKEIKCSKNLVSLSQKRIFKDTFGKVIERNAKFIIIEK